MAERLLIQPTNGAFLQDSSSESSRRAEFLNDRAHTHIPSLTPEIVFYRFMSRQLKHSVFMPLTITVCALGVAFVRLRVPETRGKSLEEIEEAAAQRAGLATRQTLNG